MPFQVKMKRNIALQQPCDTPTGTFDTREAAAPILNGGENFEFVALLFFYPEVLSSIDMVQKNLQAKEESFHQVLNQMGT